MQTKKYDNIFDNFRNKYLGFATVRLNNKYGFIDKNGEEKCELKYSNLSIYLINNKNDIVVIASLELNNKYGILNSNGKIICPFIYKNIRDFWSGIHKKISYAKIKYKDKVGIINSKGEVVVKPKYDNIEKFNNNIAVIWLNDKCGLLNHKFEELTKIKYDYIENSCSFTDNFEIHCISPYSMGQNYYDDDDNEISNRINELNENFIMGKLNNKICIFNMKGKVLCQD